MFAVVLLCLAETGQEDILLKNGILDGEQGYNLNSVIITANSTKKVAEEKQWV